MGVSCSICQVFCQFLSQFVRESANTSQLLNTRQTPLSLCF
nr:MAG TPA: hypothetical protein [Caudoviricetes sp.]